MKSSFKIGVFDSGIGGLTVVKEINKVLPNENIVYFGDTARVPYGSKSRDTIIRYSKQILEFLKTKDIKVLVIACNTASAYALNELKKDLNIPIIGVIKPGAKAALKNTKNKKIGIIGTRATVSSGIYTEILSSYDSEIKVIEKACPLLVPLVEEGLFYDRITKDMIERYTLGLKSEYIDTLVLACTHYPLLYDTFFELMGTKIKLINPAKETAKELFNLLKEKDLLNQNDKKEDEFYVSDMAVRFREFASYILNKDRLSVKKINIEEY